jgi:hypothetical protein
MYLWYLTVGYYITDGQGAAEAERQKTIRRQSGSFAGAVAPTGTPDKRKGNVEHQTGCHDKDLKKKGYCRMCTFSLRQDQRVQWKVLKDKTRGRVTAGGQITKYCVECTATLQPGEGFIYLHNSVPVKLKGFMTRSCKELWHSSKRKETRRLIKVCLMQKLGLDADADDDDDEKDGDGIGVVDDGEEEEEGDEDEDEDEE